MSTTKIPLGTVKIASPCTASWDAMSGDDKSRFCAQCSQHVYNLSTMTQEEAEALILEKEGKMCVRFYRRADGTMMTKDCPVGSLATAKAGVWYVGWRVAVVFGTAFGLVALGVLYARIRENPGVRLVNPINHVMDWLFPLPELAGPKRPGEEDVFPGEQDVLMGAICLPERIQPPVPLPPKEPAPVLPPEELKK